MVSELDTVIDLARLAPTVVAPFEETSLRIYVDEYASKMIANRGQLSRNHEHREHHETRTPITHRRHPRHDGAAAFARRLFRRAHRGRARAGEDRQIGRA